MSVFSTLIEGIVSSSNLMGRLDMEAICVFLLFSLSQPFLNKVFVIWSVYS